MKFVGGRNLGLFFLKEGDRNTKFFHRIANSQRRCNTINKLMVDEELSTDPGIIEGCTTHFYRQLYSENEVQRPLLDEVGFSRISEGNATWLDRPFDEKEVFGVVHDFNGDKAPGPNGFITEFFQSYWSMVKTDIMNVFHIFHAHDVFEKSLNTTFLALIPKKIDVVDVKAFRPISLVGGLYKIIAKVLAN